MIALKPGDILLWRVDQEAPLLDRLIGWGESKLKQRAPQGYQYYHVAFLSSAINWMYSSQPPKIDLYPVPNPLPDYVEVYRLRGGATEAGLANVFKYAESRRGRWYDFLGVATAGFVELGGLEFCSLLANDSYCQYPVCLCQNIRFPTPDDFAASGALIRVT